MGEWRVRVSVRVSPQRRTELEQCTGREKRTLSNFGALLLELGSSNSRWLVNKDAVTDVEVELDFGSGTNGMVETETLHGSALDSREAHITTSTKTDSLKQGKCSAVVSRARDYA